MFRHREKGKNPVSRQILNYFFGDDSIENPKYVFLQPTRFKLIIGLFLSILRYYIVQKKFP